MASVKIVLKESQPKKDGTIPVLIRVISGRKAKYISTGYAVKQTQFRPGTDNWIIKHPDLVLMNAAIETKRAAIAAKFYMADIEGTKVVEKKGTFLNAVKTRLNILEQRNQVASYKRLYAKIAHLRGAWGKDIQLSDLSSKWIDKYISFRIKDGSMISTIKKDLSDFSTVLVSIDYEGKDYFKRAQKTLKADPPFKEKLSLSEIKELEKPNKNISGLNDVARDMFLFAFYCHGMRFQNVAMFQKSMIKNGVIKYRMNKGKKIREIQIHPKLQAIIQKYSGSPYMFPIVKKPITDNWNKKYLIDSANTLINAHLKRVAIICGIDKNLSTHVARHSFAFLTKKRNVSTEIIQDALGHSDVKITQMYLDSFDDDEINEAVKGLYD